MFNIFYMEKENTNITQAQLAHQHVQELLFCDTPNGFINSLEKFLVLAFISEENLSKTERNELGAHYSVLVEFFKNLKSLDT